LISDQYTAVALIAFPVLLRPAAVHAVKHAPNAISCAQNTKVRKLYCSDTLILEPSDERPLAGNVWDWTINEARFLLA
jgi:hypothetical protein